MTLSRRSKRKIAGWLVGALAAGVFAVAVSDDDDDDDRDDRPGVVYEQDDDD